MSHDREEPRERGESGGLGPTQVILLILLGLFALLFSGVVFVAVCTAVQW